MAGRWVRSEKTRKFAREVGSVVLGVLIALGLGAVASEIGWRIEVLTARSALSGELGEMIGQTEERVTIDRCVERRLDQLAGIVRAAEASGKLPPLGPIGQPPYRTWPMGVWQSTVSAQTAAHIDRDLLDNYSTAYDFGEQLAHYTQKELEAWTLLYALSGPGRRFDAAEARELWNAIGQARFANRMMALAGIRMKQVTITYDLGYDDKEAHIYGGRPQAEFEICKPIGTGIPQDYGQAPLAGVVQRALADPISRTSRGLGGQK